jgi:hypothetical protein
LNARFGNSIAVRTTLLDGAEGAHGAVILS